MPSQGWTIRSRPVRHLTVDSREVTPGSAFIAVAGQTTDGHLHIPEAIGNGAAVVFHEPGKLAGLDPPRHPDITFVPVVDTCAFAERVAAPFYGFPSRRMKVTAITGTNGKSTCTLLLENLARGLGRRTGVINTFGVRYGEHSFRLANMVPEPVRLQTLLFAMAEAGVQSLVLEVTSQALAAGRLRGMDLDAAVLTNVTRDHLDVHGTMEAYLEAKLSLFDLLAQSEKQRRIVSLWRDCWSFPVAVGRAADLGLRSFTHFVAGSRRSGVEEAPGPGSVPTDGDPLWADRLALGLSGTDFDLHWRGRTLRCHTSLLGAFNVLNILAVLGSEPEFLEAALGGDGWAQATLREALAATRVPGRLQAVPNALGVTILVDYAHTEDGLGAVLSLLRSLPHRRICTVFGCGGDRDPGKRPKMGAVAARLSDHVILTTDNPRTEEPAAIIRDIEAGLPRDSQHLVVEDRAEAIAVAIDGAGEGDILLIAGKGHEEMQIVGTEEVPFSDVEVVRAHLTAKGWG